MISKGVADYGFIAAPAFAKINNSSATSWSDSLSYLLDNDEGRIKTVTMHTYPLGSSSSGLSVPDYLSKFLKNQYTYDDIFDTLGGLIPSVNLTNSRNLQFRLAEMNSISGGGTNQVSNSFGAALWGLDYMYELAKAGAAGINFATEGGSTVYYSPFTFNSNFVGAGKVSVRPLYYGIWLFSKAVQKNATFVKQNFNSNIDSDQVKIWTTIDTSKTIRTVIINRGKTLTDTSTKTIQITYPGRTGNAKVYLLKAASTNGFGDTTGVTLAGQSISNMDGAIQNTETTFNVSSSGGVYTFNVKAATAVLIELPKNTCEFPPIANVAARCDTGSVILSAIPASDETIDWYADSTGGTALVTGNTSFTTPVLNTTTTYFAQSRNTITGCAFPSRVAVTATVKLLSSSFTDTTICSSAVPFSWNGNNYSTSGTYAVHFTNAAGCDSAASLNLTVIPCSSMMNLQVKLYLQGAYLENGMMKPVLQNQGVVADSTITDSVTIAIYDSATFNLVQSATVLLNTDGTATVNMMQVPAAYYIVVNHRNTIETWSSMSVNLHGGSTNWYDFTTAASKAMGDNQVEVEPGIWAMYSGDLNQDENIDISDYVFWEAAYYDLLSGYETTDINGDGNVDITDYTIWELSYYNLISSVHP